MHYTHRNNERTPPTEEGWFWFDGHETDDDFPCRVAIRLKLVGEPPLLAAINTDDEHIWLYISDLTGKWSGPFPFNAPWEE